MKRYEIQYRATPPKLDATDAAWWADVPSDVIDCVNWPSDSPLRRTEFRIVWCDGGLYLRYECEDKAISAVATETNGYVWQDSCVEVFVAPNAEKPLNYYNFEMNCVGTFLMGTHCDWAEGYMDRSQAISIRVATSVPGPTKAESPDDQRWSLVVHIPWKHFENDAAALPPRAGDLWRANVYRIGGKTDVQCASWSPITRERPQFHSPECFSEIVFAKS
jgi:cellulose/xylan binding protein with CBM9 domain